MSAYDEQYLTIAENILNNGFLSNNRTGVRAWKLPHQIMLFDLRVEFPILTVKKMPFKTAVKELLWIYRDQSSNVRLLQEQGVNIWDEWMMPDGTIGTSYGWVVREYKQVDKLIDSLVNNPDDRRMMINLWQIPHLETGALAPCCFLTMWDVCEGFLNCMLVQRSADWGLGVPFNTTQYAVLVHLLAQVAGLKPGLLTHVVNNAHIYENHVDAIREQMGRKSEAFSAPSLLINPDVHNFYDFSANDICLRNYNSHAKVKMDIAV
ncbi:MAG: thymidylate synthase [Clostridiales bacterium]|nr:thymidylate synthase [Clostridiales bacterium]